MQLIWIAATNDGPGEETMTEEQLLRVAAEGALALPASEILRREVL